MTAMFSRGNLAAIGIFALSFGVNAGKSRKTPRMVGLPPGFPDTHFVFVKKGLSAPFWHSERFEGEWGRELGDWIGSPPSVFRKGAVELTERADTNVGSITFHTKPVPTAASFIDTIAVPDLDCSCGYEDIQAGLMVSKSTYSPGKYIEVEAVLSNTKYQQSIWLQGDSGEINIMDYFNGQNGTSWTNNFHCFQEGADPDTTVEGTVGGFQIAGGSDGFMSSPNQAPKRLQKVVGLSSSAMRKLPTKKNAYGVYWTDTELKFYFEGVLTNEYNISGVDCLNEPMRLILSTETRDNDLPEDDAAWEDNKPFRVQRILTFKLDGSAASHGMGLSRSAKSCQDLMAPTSTAKGTWRHTANDPYTLVCSNIEYAGDGACPPTKSSNEMTYTEAKLLCAKEGARLCTKTENELDFFSYKDNRYDMPWLNKKAEGGGQPKGNAIYKCSGAKKFKFWFEAPACPNGLRSKSRVKKDMGCEDAADALALPMCCADVALDAPIQRARLARQSDGTELGDGEEEEEEDEDEDEEEEEEEE